MGNKEDELNEHSFSYNILEGLGTITPRASNWMKIQQPFINSSLFSRCTVVIYHTSLKVNENYQIFLLFLEFAEAVQFNNKLLVVTASS